MSLMKIKTAADTHEADYNLAKMLDMPGGLEKIALEKLPPFIRETRDYEAFARKILVAHNVSGEELQLINGEPYYYYPKDFDSYAAFYGDDGEIPRTQIEGDGVNVGIMTVASDDITINLKRLIVQKYNYLERVRELSGQAIGKVEDKKFINLIETLLTGTGTAAAPQFDGQIVDSSDTNLTKAHLIALRKTQSQHNVPLAFYVMHQSRIDDILGWDQDEVDELTQREILETGVKYKIWGSVMLVTSPIIDPNVVYSFAEAEYVGRMPILKDLTVRLTETPNKLEKGLFMFEFIGMYLSSQKAVGKLILGFTNGDDKTSVSLVDSTTVKDGDAVTGYGAL